MAKLLRSAKRLGSTAVRYQIEVQVEKLCLGTGLEENAELSVAFQRGTKVLVTENEATYEDGIAEWQETATPLKQMCTLYLDKAKGLQKKTAKLVVRRRCWTSRKGTHYVAIGSCEFNIADTVNVSYKSTQLVKTLSKCTDPDATLQFTVNSQWIKNYKQGEDGTASELSVDSTASGRLQFSQEVVPEDIEERTGENIVVSKPQNPFSTTTTEGIKKQSSNPFLAVGSSTKEEDITASVNETKPVKAFEIQSVANIQPKRLVAVAKVVSNPFGNNHQSTTPRGPLNELSALPLENSNNNNSSIEARLQAAMQDIARLRREKKSLETENRDLMTQLIDAKVALAEVNMKVDTYQQRCATLRRKSLRTK